jgi:hypothetical protein
MYHFISHETNSALFPQSYLFFSSFPEQVFIISLYITALFGFITETDYVYCAVQTDSLNILRFNTVEARVRLQLGPFEICDG